MKTKGTRSVAGFEKLTPEELKQRNLETYGLRIKKYRKRAGLKAEELADALQISKSCIFNWECGLTRPDPAFLYKMFPILNVEPNEFFGIQGIGNALTNREKGLIDIYRSLDRRSQSDLEALADTLAKRSFYRQLNKTYKRINNTSDYGRSASAGSQGADWSDYPEEKQVLLYSSSVVCNADEIITVSGASMEPQFYDGDKVLVEYCTAIRNGDIGIFYVPGIGGVIKQRAYDRLHSLNPDYDDIFPYEEGAQLIGRVLGKVDNSMIPSSEEQKLYEEAVSERENDPEAFDAFDDE